MIRRTVVTALFVILTLSPLYAEGRPETSGVTNLTRPVPVRVAVLKGPTGMGMIKLIDEQPAFSGYEVTYIVSGSPDVLVSRVLSGSVDIAALPSNVAVKLYNSGIDYPMLAVHTLGVLYLLTNGPEIHSWQDLRGHEVGCIGRGANPDVIFRTLLSRNSLVPDEDVTLRFFGHAELAGLLIAGRQNLGVHAEPFVTRILEGNPNAHIAMDLQEEWRRSFGPDAIIALGSLVVRGEFLAENRDFVRKFLGTYRDSVDWVNSSPHEAGALIEKHDLGFSREAAENAIPRAGIVYIPSIQARIRFENYLSVLLAADPESLGGRLPPADFYAAP